MLRTRNPSRSTRVVAPLLFALAAAGLASPVQGANSLATPITAELRQELWPVRIAVEIVELRRDLDRDAGEPMPYRAVEVPDGHRVSFATGTWTPRGHRDFTVDVTAHHHPRGEMEIEWDLVVEDAPYETVSVGEYVLHRLRFGPRPKVGPRLVRVSRADIVSTRGEPHVETVEIGDEKYEIRIVALSVRG